MSKRRVVVTGLGLISPCGNSVAEGWAHVRDGVSGITPIDQYDASAFSTRFAGTIRNFDPTAYMEPKEARKCDPENPDAKLIEQQLEEIIGQSAPAAAN